MGKEAAFITHVVRQSNRLMSRQEGARHTSESYNSKQLPFISFLGPSFQVAAPQMTDAITVPPMIIGFSSAAVAAPAMALKKPAQSKAPGGST